MKKKIVIVDDDLGIQDIFRFILEREGYETTIYSGAKALFQNKTDKPNVYLLDKQLGGMEDGLDICRHLKSDITTKDVPVVMVSATPGIKDMAKQAGANDYIEKPFSKRELIAIIEKNMLQ
ncbi:MAG TPA: response regulator [Ferruginibacter sp.]|nr:response regulator [Ferruginibacter sp.]